MYPGKQTRNERRQIKKICHRSLVLTNFVEGLWAKNLRFTGRRLRGFSLCGGGAAAAAAECTRAMFARKCRCLAPIVANVAEEGDSLNRDP